MWYPPYLSWFWNNTWLTSKKTILAQTQEKRLLPVGRTEFDEWANRIISGTLLPADHESMKFALADMLLRLSPTECAKDDAFFISSLRKYAVNQVADTVRKEIHAAAKARLALEETAKAEEDAALSASKEASDATLTRAQQMKEDIKKAKDTVSVPQPSDVTPTLQVSPNELLAHG
jgi:hypothetical protein